MDIKIIGLSLPLMNKYGVPKGYVYGGRGINGQK